MPDPIISIENVGKRYRLGATHHDTLRDRLGHALRAPFRRLRGAAAPDPAEFWALRDVSFTVGKGEVVGIVGRNGAGKSTLLKILSRITEPTTGRVAIRGRIASLLEVGTGFHPELSGRENIFLNGAILGMARAEIRRKFDEIVAFAEIARFIDTPVKHYSSGMYVRLAFAVAAHLEPEILIVDEVLAVGDIAFQKKCLGKMREVSRNEGRTVLFVSHNLPSIRTLCTSGVLLAGGRVSATGAIAKILDLYQHGLGDALAASVPAPTADLLDRAYVTGVTLETLEGRPTALVFVGQSWRVRIAFRVVQRQAALVIAVGLSASDGTPIQTAWQPPQDLAPGDYEAEFVQDSVTLEAASYILSVGLSAGDRTIQQFSAERLDISSDQVLGQYAPASAGVGFVLNSMRRELRRVS